MAARAIERIRQTGSMEYRRPTAMRDYVVIDAGDKITAQFAVVDASPSFDLGIDMQTEEPINIFRNKIDIKECGGGVWEAVVHYNSTPNIMELSINFGVKTQKKYNAILQRKTYDAIAGIELEPGDDYSISNMPDYGTQIGVTDDGVEGVDVEVGAVEITISKKMQRAMISPAYYKLLMDFTSDSAVNHEDFVLLWLGQSFDFPKGSLRFRSASMKSNTQEELSLDLYMAYSRPITDADAFTVGVSPNIIAEGWDYVWTKYRKEVANGRTTTTPVGVVVQQIYPYRDFNGLQLEA
jgi:hypothetical protein